MNLRKIENEIKEILTENTHSWVRLYELIREVEYINYGVTSIVLSFGGLNITQTLC